MRRSTREALKQLAAMLADTSYNPPLGDYNSNIHLSPETFPVLNNNKIKFSLSSTGIVLARLFSIGNPLSYHPDHIEVGIEPEEFLEDLEAAASNSLMLVSHQLLAPQGFHQPIYGLNLIAASLADDTVNQEMQRLKDTLNAATNLAMVDMNSPTGGWATYKKQLEAAAGEGLKDMMSSLAGGYKIVDHNLWKSEMKRIGADGILAGIFLDANAQTPKKSSPTYGYVAFVDPMQSYSRVESEICGIGNTLIPPLEWSRAVPYFNIQVLGDFSVSKYQLDSSIARESQMSLTKWIESGLAGVFDDYPTGRLDERYDGDVLLGSDGKPMSKAEEGFSMNVIKTGYNTTGQTRAGMEIFTTPQSIVPAGQGSEAFMMSPGYTSVDKMRPFMTVENFSVQVMPTRGASSTVRATLVMMLHDRGRLQQVGQLLRPEILGNTEFDIEWGWSHPSSGPIEQNIYGKFINSLRQRQKFNLYQSSYSFTADGQVQITLSMVSKGIEMLNQTDAGMTGQVEESWRTVELAFKAVSLAREKCNSVDNFERYAKGISELSGNDVVNTIDLSSTGLLISTDNKAAINKWMEQAKATDGVPELQELVDVFSTLKAAVESADASLKEDLDRKLSILKTTSYEDWAMYTKGTLPESTPGGGGFLYKTDNGNLPKGWTKKKGMQKQGGYIPLGAFIQMFVAQPLMASQLYDEVQVITYTANLNAGAASGANLGAIPIHLGMVGKKTFQDILNDQYTTYGGQYPVTRFIEWLVSNFVEPQLSPCHGFADGVGDFAYDKSTLTITATKNATKDIAKTAASNLRKLYYGSESEGGVPGTRPTPFSPIKLKLLYEVAPSSKEELVGAGVMQTATSALGDLTVLRIHVLDAVAEGAEGAGWIDVLKQSRSSSGATIKPPEDSRTPGMSDASKVASNWSANKMTTRRVCNLLAQRGILEPSQASTMTVALTPEDRARYEQELADLKFTLKQWLPLGSTSKLAEKKRINDRIKVIEQALLAGQAPADPSEYGLVANKANQIIKLCSSMAPNIVYGREGSLVNSLQVKQRSNSKSSTTYMMRTLSAGGVDADQPRGAPMRLGGADISIDTFGNPALKFMQRYFIDADTNTTIDNLYAVSGIDHKISPNEFTTTLKMVPLEAYGVFQNLTTDVDRASDIITGLKLADGKRKSAIRLNNTNRRARKALQTRATQLAGINNLVDWIGVRSFQTKTYYQVLIYAYARGFGAYSRATNDINPDGWADYGQAEAETVLDEYKTQVPAGDWVGMKTNNHLLDDLSFMEDLQDLYKLKPNWSKRVWIHLSEDPRGGHAGAQQRARADVWYNDLKGDWDERFAARSFSAAVGRTAYQEVLNAFKKKVLAGGMSIPPSMTKKEYIADFDGYHAAVIKSCEFPIFPTSGEQFFMANIEDDGYYVYLPQEQQCIYNQVQQGRKGLDWSDMASNDKEWSWWPRNLEPVYTQETYGEQERIADANWGAPTDFTHVWPFVHGTQMRNIPGLVESYTAQTPFVVTRADVHANPGIGEEGAEISDPTILGNIIVPASFKSMQIYATEMIARSQGGYDESAAAAEAGGSTVDFGDE